VSDYSLAVAFGAGVLSFLSPCVLPLVPIYLANLGGAVSLSAETRRWTVFFHAISFVAGFSIVFTGVGASFGLIGVVFPTNLLRIIGGAVLILFGLFLLAATKIPQLNYYEFRLRRSFRESAGYLRSALMGAVFSIALGPCTGPIIGGILVLAGSAQQAWKGAYLLAAYSLGLGLPFIAVGLALGAALPVLKWLRRWSNIISIVSGILLIIVGILMLADPFDMYLNF